MGKNRCTEKNKIFWYHIFPILNAMKIEQVVQYWPDLHTFLIQKQTTSSFVQDTLHGMHNYMTSQLLFIDGVICVHPISQISKTCIAFHPIPRACFVSNLLMFFICDDKNYFIYEQQLWRHIGTHTNLMNSGACNVSWTKLEVVGFCIKKGM